MCFFLNFNFSKIIYLGFWEGLPGQRLRIFKYVLKLLVFLPEACRGLLGGASGESVAETQEI